MFYRLGVCLSFLICANLTFAQSSYWKKTSKTGHSEKALTQNLEDYDLFTLQLETFASLVPGKELAGKIELPNADGELSKFKIWDAPIMEPGLAAKYPQIRTFLIESLEDKSTHGRLSLTNGGVNALIQSTQESYYIAPTEYAADTYAVYTASERSPLAGFSCLVEGEELHDHVDINQRTTRQLGEELRIYKLAVATTGEYSSYHGGSISTVMEAIVETMNLVNVPFENDFSVRFVLVDNNDLLINLNANSDPFNNDSASQMLGANTSFINGAIGVVNYDIGHVFATGGAGLASLRSNCTNRKAQGATGIFPPEGNSFAIDYVAHELGHQLGSNHTFNNCPGQESQSFAYEPGSGSTIMGYAGLCGSNNVQFSSDEYFHVSSLEQISDWIEGAGNNCADISQNENSVPTVDAGEGGFFIPFSTPFKLTAEGNDEDGDALTYCWEQYNLGPQSDFGNPTGSAPSFRSQSPSLSPTRYFPRLSNLIGNSANFGEVLPAYTRGLNFRCTVRDNKAGGGAAAWDEMSFIATDDAGPFVITSQNSAGVVWETNRLATVTWDVANTDQEPVNCQKVNILMSRNNGNTFDIPLATNVDNNGTHTFFVPDGAVTTIAYVMVEAADNVFFNVNDRRFSVVEAPPTSVDQTFQDEIQVYPNPSDGLITLSMGAELSDEIQIDVIDVQGRPIKSYVQNTQIQEMRLDIPAGVYFLKIQQADRLAYKRVVISK